MYMEAESKLALNLGALKETRLLYREKEFEQISMSMTNGIHTFIYGSTGTGKTTTVKRAIEKFNGNKHKAFYVSCTNCRTEYSILKEIIDQINSQFVQKIFIETRCNYDLAKRLKKEREKTPSLKVVVLDHLQALSESKAVDCLIEIGFTIILVSDEQRAIAKLSPLSQSYFANSIHFGDYTLEQIAKILRSKADSLVGEGNYTESLISKIAQFCNGNIGFGESLLLASSMKAIESRKDSVDADDVPQISKSENGPSPDEKTILEILNQEHSLQGGELYKLYCERTKFPKAERTFRNYMRDLCEKDLVKAIGTNKGRVYEIRSLNAGGNYG